MDGELITAIAATGVSLVATGYAAMQARIAKRAARSAEEQVVLMRRQIEGEEADRFEARGPQFSIKEAHTDESDVNVPRGKLVIKQGSGPPLSSVIVSATGEGVEGMRGASESNSYAEYRREQHIDIGPMAAGGTHDVYVDLDYHTRDTTIQLHLECRNEAGETWQRSYAARVEPLPEEPLWRRSGRTVRG
ncbi:hypothetical protein ACFU93_21345 [Streptomyces sp. NPDC057611]|uniref:hypothetical protein n=1 Tax=Streptomyces sp. NPDC057611 TaxID=3346182 RepID=UPI0036C7F600